ncbi:MAG: NUDIX hydrolase [Rothia sp. (in: high G+C Gram-positive bacteria)]|nr:NUDIX hydrolase [Rothia sp. (in: high G+C Gram-positive bacteria)]
MPKTPVYIANRRDGNFSVTRTQANAADVTAAGCLVWRYKNDQLEVLLIHRPHYDDWSWPKGKQDRGETIAETAIREVREEVNLKVSLGVPLAVTHYKVKQGSKDVYYWAAQVPANARPSADKKEVDQLRWVTSSKAASLLTNSSDLLPLKHLEKLWQQGDLLTRPVVIVRHAKAKPRSSWSAAEGERPLAATGKRQALAVCRLLAAWSPERIYSSPWVRCMQTIISYNKDTGVPIKEKSAITEAAHKRHPKRAAKVVAALFDKDYPVALCTHRPVLPTVLQVLAQHTNKELADWLPAQDPYLSPGEMLVLQVSQRHKDKVISLEQIRPFSD